MISELYVTIVLPGATQPTLVGRLRLDERGRDLDAEFVYGRRYCGNPNAIALDPLRLPLNPDVRYTADGLWGPLSVFRDASPDSWGRRVLEREASVAELPEAEYLLRAGPARVGALGFQVSQHIHNIHTEVDQPPKIVSLAELDEAARRLEAGTDIDDRLMRLLHQGSSVGGARPKVTVVSNGIYWLAKFSARDDRLDMPQIEYATLKLAREAGIEAPSVRMSKLPGERHALMIRRFDRVSHGGGWHRYHFMSGLTLLGLHESDNARGGYPALADVLRKVSTNARTDTKQLFRRMVFNILTGNDDDHLRNHAVLHYPKGWRLSPAYDLVPHPVHSYTRYQAIQVGEHGRQATLENALSQSERFGLRLNDANQIIDEVASVLQNWRTRFSRWGVSEKDIDQLGAALLPESAMQSVESQEDDDQYSTPQSSSR